MHIKIKKGLDIPLRGYSDRFLGEAPQPRRAGLELSCFDEIRFVLRVHEGDQVSVGEPLAHDKNFPERVFVSPVAGKVVEIKRGEKRRLLAVGMELSEEQPHAPFPKVSESAEAIVQAFLEAGIFAHIRMRPCNLLANPKRLPKSIFVQGLSSAPYEPSPELEIQENKEAFVKGLKLLSKIAPVHLVCRKLIEIEGVQVHTAEGPHPIANPSLHIYHIDPITSRDQVVWTVQAHDVIAMGVLALEGRYYNQRLIALAGEPVPEKRRGLCKVTVGTQIKELFEGQGTRVISGNPLMGRQVTPGDYLGFSDSVLCTIEESHKRRLMHFLRPGTKSFSAMKAYLTSRKPSFSTLQHGEHRAFVDGSVYQRVVPMELSVMHLMKALLAENLELAEEAGLLEVAAEDFALAEFICPSKIPMCAIAHRGLLAYASQFVS